MCSSFVIYAAHKEHRTRQEYWSLKTLTIFMTSLQGKNEVEVKIENSMHNYNATLVHCYHTFGMSVQYFWYLCYSHCGTHQSIDCWRILLFYNLATR